MPVIRPDELAFTQHVLCGACFLVCRHNLRVAFPDCQRNTSPHHALAVRLMSNYPCITVQAGARDGNNVRGEPGAGFRHNNRDVHDVVVPDFPYALKPLPTICASALAAMAKQNRFGPARAVLFTATFDVHLHPIREYGGFRDDLITVALAEDTGVNFAQFVRRDMNVLNVDPGNIIAGRDSSLASNFTPSPAWICARASSREAAGIETERASLILERCRVILYFFMIYLLFLMQPFRRAGLLYAKIVLNIKRPGRLTRALCHGFWTLLRFYSRLRTCSNVARASVQE